MKNPFCTRARIVRDHYCGYEVQIRRWWLPIWLRAGTNTHASAERAEDFARNYLKCVVKEIEL